MPTDAAAPALPALPARLLGWLGWIELGAAVAAFLAVIGIVAWNVTLRYLFNQSLIWSEEISLLCLSISVFFGAAVLHKARADVAIAVLVDRLPPGLRRIVVVGSHAIALAFFAVLATQCAALWPIQRLSATLIVEIGRFWYTLPLLLAAVSAALTSAWFLWCTVAGGSTEPLLTLPQPEQGP